MKFLSLVFFVSGLLALQGCATSGLEPGSTAFEQGESARAKAAPARQQVADLARRLSEHLRRSAMTSPYSSIVPPPDFVGPALSPRRVIRHPWWNGGDRGRTMP
jgi:hypothetical protein